MNITDHMDHEVQKEFKIKELKNGNTTLTKNNSNLKKFITSFYDNVDKIDKLDKVVDFKINEEDISKLQEYNRNKPSKDNLKKN